MKSGLKILAAAVVAFLPAMARAKIVNFTVRTNNYGGYPAYLAVYLTDAQGHYKETIHLAGSRLGFFEHLREWMTASQGQVPTLDGITGASVGSGQSLRFSANISDALLNAGYEIHVDAEAEWMMEMPDEVVVPLDQQHSGKPVAGRGYLSEFAYSM